MSHYIIAHDKERPVILAGPYRAASDAWDDIRNAFECSRTFDDAKELTMFGVQYLAGFKVPGRLNLKGFSSAG